MFHKFIKSSPNLVTLASHAVTQSQHISIHLQLITTHNTHNQIWYYRIQIIIHVSCKTHKWRTLKKSRQQCALPLGPLSRPLATFSHLVVPNHDQDWCTVLSSYSDSSVNHGRHSTDHPSFSAKTQTPRCLPACYILAQPAGRWPN